MGETPSFAGILNEKQEHMAALPVGEKMAFHETYDEFLGVSPYATDLLEIIFKRRRIYASSYVRADFAVAIKKPEEVKRSGALKDLHDLLAHPFIPNLLQLVAGNQDPRSRFVTGLLLSQVPEPLMPTTVKNVIQPQGNAGDISIQEANGFYNCAWSEKSMRKSIRDEDTVLVNDSLLVKNQGYKTALCLKTTSTSQGTFYEGGFYTPWDRPTREAILDKLVVRAPTLTLESGEWVYVRTARTETKNKRLMAAAKVYVNDLKTRLKT